MVKSSVVNTYRKNAGVIIVGQDGRVLVFERIEMRRHGVWQFPQGGIDPGETPLQTALRELAEETGLEPSAVELIDEYPDWLTYDYPPDALGHGGYRGQTQRWFFVRLLAPESAIKLAQPHPEFINYRWTTLEDAARDIVDFKKPVYERLAVYGRERGITASRPSSNATE